jgi:DNA-binding transcriptional MerR regulator
VVSSQKEKDAPLNKKRQIGCEEVPVFTVHEVSELTGVSVRTLQHYDNIGLLHPAKRTEAGYRLYGEAELEKLQQILLFRELEFPLKEIKRIIAAPDFDKARALEQQIELLMLKREHVQNLIDLAQRLKERSANTMDFEAFDTSKMDEYAKRAKESWGTTPEYKEFEEKTRDRTPGEQQSIAERFMQVFVEFGAMKDSAPDSPEAQAQVKTLQDFISKHYYQCSDEVLAGLGKMYGSGGEFTVNINKAGGEGTAEFAAQAIEAYCAR